MKENLLNEPYIDDDCLIEDDFYNNIKDIIKCQYCYQILKEPMMCNVCTESFCNNCVKKMQKKKSKNHTCKKAKYVKNLNVIKAMSKLKYLCRNCKNEITKADIENHLKNGCEKNENPSKLLDSLYRKKLLIKLNKDEIRKLGEKNENINHISSKIFINFILVILLGRGSVGKSSLINT